jgi:DNA-directed RNA polymerase sigma subunit (sigma70/sigma32)
MTPEEILIEMESICRRMGELQDRMGHHEVRQRLVVLARAAGWSLTDLGVMLGIARKRVRMIERRAAESQEPTA